MKADDVMSRYEQFAVKSTKQQVILQDLIVPFGTQNSTNPSNDIAVQSSPVGSALMCYLTFPEIIFIQKVNASVLNKEKMLST